MPARLLQRCRTAAIGLCEQNHRRSDHRRSTLASIPDDRPCWRLPVALSVLNEVKRIDALRHADEGWALYVKGTEAFLRRKPLELAKYIEDLSTFADRHGPTETVARLNNNVLKGFARCIDSTYKAAYAPPCLDVQESRAIMQRQRNISPIR